MYNITQLSSENEYKQYYIENYCIKPIKAIDAIEVNFYEHQFEHAFFKTDRKTSKKTRSFDKNRGEKIGWIKDVLTDSSTEVYEGKPGMKDRQVYINNSFVVVVRKISPQKAIFVTNFIGDADALTLIRTNKKIK